MVFSLALKDDRVEQYVSKVLLERIPNVGSKARESVGFSACRHSSVMYMQRENDVVTVAS